jgi:hypothetical protein
VHGEETDRWILSEEIPTAGGEFPDRAISTAEDAELIWNNRAAKVKEIAERFRYCRGCVYLRTCGSWFACTYLLTNDKKRPCPPGKRCKVREYPPGYTVPKEHLEWCKKVDREEKERLSAVSGEKPKRKRGKDPTWDTEYAKQLYQRGFSLREICEIMGLNKNTLSSFMNNNGWAEQTGEWKKRKVFPKSTPEQIEDEKRKFRQHTEEKRKQW